MERGACQTAAEVLPSGLTEGFSRRLERRDVPGEKGRIRGKSRPRAPFTLALCPEIPGRRGLAGPICVHDPQELVGSKVRELPEEDPSIGRPTRATNDLTADDVVGDLGEP